MFYRCKRYNLKIKFFLTRTFFNRRFLDTLRSLLLTVKYYSNWINVHFLSTVVSSIFFLHVLVILPHFVLQPWSTSGWRAARFSCLYWTNISSFRRAGICTSRRFRPQTMQTTTVSWRWQRFRAIAWQPPNHQPKQVSAWLSTSSGKVRVF